MEQEKLKSLLGDSYKDGMTDDEAIEVLSQLRADELSKYTKDKASFDKTSKELADLKKKQGEKLTEEEKQREEFERLKTENERLVREGEIRDLTTRYMSLGYDSKLAHETAEAFVNKDTAKVLTNQEKFNKIREEAIKADLLKKTPRPDPSNPDDTGTVTKEQFDRMTLSQRTELYQKDPELYKQLRNGGK